MDNLGINYKRRKRQSNENAKIILDCFITELEQHNPIIGEDFTVKSISASKYKVNYYSNKADSLCEKIQADWAIPILIESISRLYEGDLKEYIEYGVVYKRALSYIWKSNFPNYYGTRKNIDSIVELLKLCYMIEMINGEEIIFVTQKDFEYKVKKGYITYDDKFYEFHEFFANKMAGRGKRLRISEENSRLIGEKDFLTSLLYVIEGKNPSSIELFKGTFYEKIPGINNDDCLDFWQTVFFRSLLYYYSLMSEELDEDSSNVIIFHEFATTIPEGFVRQDIIENTFWREDWLKKQDLTRYGNLVCERPIFRISSEGDFATSSFLIGDSINHYIEDSILEYTDRYDRAKLPNDVFKKTISEPFEDEIVKGMIDLGFVAGHVSEAGVWQQYFYNNNQIERKDVILRFDDKLKLYGEIDTFAFLPGTNLAILVECKVLHDYRSLRSFKNLVNKLQDDSEGFRNKINHKAKWLKKAMEFKYKNDVEIIKILLTDISLPIFNKEDDDIFLCDKNMFFNVLEHLLEECCN